MNESVKEIIPTKYCASLENLIKSKIEHGDNQLKLGMSSLLSFSLNPLKSTILEEVFHIKHWRQIF